jgi:hypothetical protein
MIAPKPVTIRGDTFPSAAAAAEALGVGVKTIYKARSRNALDLIGTGAKVLPVTIRGVTYENKSAAARALGVTSVAICNAEAAGRLDFVGTGAKVKAVTIRGTTYPSHRAASEALRVCPETIARAEKLGRLDDVGIMRIMDADRKDPGSHNVTTCPPLRAGSRMPLEEHRARFDVWLLKLNDADSAEELSRRFRRRFSAGAVQHWRLMNGLGSHERERNAAVQHSRKTQAEMRPEAPAEVAPGPRLRALLRFIDIMGRLPSTMRMAPRTEGEAQMAWAAWEAHKAGGLDEPAARNPAR